MTNLFSTWTLRSKAALAPRKFIRLGLGLGLAVAASTGCLQIGTAQEPELVETITLQDYLTKLKQNHPLFKSEPIQIKIAQAERRAALGAEDWVLLSNPRYGFDEPVGSSTFNPEELTTIGLNAGLEKPFWKNGSRLGLNWDYQHLDQITRDFMIPGSTMAIPTGFPNYHQNQLSLTYTLPLLQNKGGGLDRLQADVRGFLALSAGLQAAESQEQFILESAKRFVDWSQLFEQTDIARSREVLAQTMYENNVSNRVANAVSKIDLLRSESDLSSAKQNTLLTQSQANSIRIELAMIAYWPEVANYAPDLDLFALPDTTNQTDSVDHTRSLKLFALEAKRLARESEGLAETAKPRLDLNLGAGLSGGGEDFSESTELNQPNYGASLGIRIPLGNGAAKANIEVNELRQEKALLDERKARIQLESALAALKLQMAELRKVIALNEKQLSAAKNRTAEEVIQYKRGKSPLTFVIQSRDAEATAKILRAQNAATFHKLFLEQEAMLDRIFEIP